MQTPGESGDTSPQRSGSVFFTSHWPVILLTVVVVIFFAIVEIFPYSAGKDLMGWTWRAWNTKNDFIHGWAIPFLFVAFVCMAWDTMKKEPVKPMLSGLILVVFGLLLYIASARTLQPRIALIGLPFLIVGGVSYVYGWRVARHMLFPAFFWYFAIPVPGIQQATNFLQVAVTNSCYHVGQAVGMDLVHTGNDIRSATNKWDSLNIAAGCSGIRSLMALVMISAIYAYYTQKEVWKKAFLFACALPLALVANFFRIFTIIVLAEMGYSDFAAGAWHDWAGLLFFFPIALSGLFLIDRLLNWRAHKKVIRKRIQR
jgi:exosortase